MARLFDMHIHTTKGSSDSNLSPEEMVLQAEQLGLFGLCITEHSGPWDRHEFQRFADQHDVILIRAMEVETDMGHILAFGMDRYLSGINKAVNLRQELDKVGGFMVTAHPFRNLYPVRPNGRPLIYQSADHVPSTVSGASEHPIFSLVDAVEVANGATSNIENEFAFKVGETSGIKGDRGQRCSLPERVGTVCDCLRSGDSHRRGVHKRPPPWEFRSCRAFSEQDQPGCFLDSCA